MMTTYDPEADALHLRTAESAIAESEELALATVLDPDVTGRVIAIELLKAKPTLALGAAPLAAE